MRRYTATVTEPSLATLHGLLKLVAQTNRTTFITRVSVTTDAAAADSMNIQIGRATGGGTTTAVTPRKKSDNDTAYSGLVYDLTADTDATMSSILDDERVDVRAGYHWRAATLDDAIEIPGAGIFLVRLNEGITAANTKIVVDFSEAG